MAVSKNSKTNRGGGQKIRALNGKEVKAVLYVGWHEGRGKYMAGSVDGEIVRDDTGRPVPLKECGDLVYNIEE